MVCHSNDHSSAWSIQKNKQRDVDGKTSANLASYHKDENPPESIELPKKTVDGWCEPNWISPALSGKYNLSCRTSLTCSRINHSVILSNSESEFLDENPLT